MFLIVGIAGLAINTTKDRGSQWTDGEDVTFVVDMSIGNNGKHEDYYVRAPVTAMIILNVITIGLIIIGSIILRKLQNKVINDIDEKNLTPADFGVMATNLPLNKTQEEVKEWLKETFKTRGDAEELDVVYVNYSYNIKDIVIIVRKLTRLQQIRAYLISYRRKKLKEEGITEQEAEAREIDLTPPASRYCC